jgi:hypothetical protein
MKNGPYILILAPPGYKGKVYRGKYVYEHRLVLEQKLGRLLEENEIAHHKNEIKNDNRPSNIELKTKAGHTSHQHIEMVMIKLQCAKCGDIFEKAASYVRGKAAIGQKSYYCSRKCMASDFGRGRPKLTS